MNILAQIAIIFGITLLGELITYTFELPLPGNVVGMILLVVFLGVKFIQESDISDVSQFINKNMAFLFIPAGVSIIENIPILQGHLLQVISVCILATMITLVVTAFTVQGVVKLQEQFSKAERSKN